MDKIEAGEGVVFLLLIAALAYVVYRAVATGAGAVASGAKTVGAAFSATPAPGAVTPESPAGGSASLGLSDWLWNMTHPNDPYSAAPGSAVPGPTVSGPGRSASPPLETNFGITDTSWDTTYP